MFKLDWCAASLATVILAVLIAGLSLFIFAALYNPIIMLWLFAFLAVSGLWGIFYDIARKRNDRS